MARDAGITLAAIARADGFEVFTHPYRILFGTVADAADQQRAQALRSQCRRQALHEVHESGMTVVAPAPQVQHLVAAAQIFVDGLGLGRGFNNDDIHVIPWV